MVTERTLDRAKQRTQRYWYVDGLAEIGFGGALLLGAAYYAVAVVVPTRYANMLLMAQPALLVGAYLLASRVIRTLKERLTYPRTGYVAYRQLQGANRVWALGTTLILAFGVARSVVILDGRVDRDLWPVLVGMAISVVMLVLGINLGMARFFILSLGSALLGAGTSLARLDWPASAALFLAFAGLGAIISGGITLRRYLLETDPAPVQNGTIGEDA